MDELFVVSLPTGISHETMGLTIVLMLLVTQRQPSQYHTKSHAPKERERGGLNMQALVLIVIILVIAIVITMVILTIVIGFCMGL